VAWRQVVLDLVEGPQPSSRINVERPARRRSPLHPHPRAMDSDRLAGVRASARGAPPAPRGPRRHEEPSTPCVTSSRTPPPLCLPRQPQAMASISATPRARDGGQDEGVAQELAAPGPPQGPQQRHRSPAQLARPRHSSARKLPDSWPATRRCASIPRSWSRRSAARRVAQALLGLQPRAGEEPKGLTGVPKARRGRDGGDLGLHPHRLDHDAGGAVIAQDRLDLGQEAAGDHDGEASAAPLEVLPRPVLGERPVQGEAVGGAAETLGQGSGQRHEAGGVDMDVAQPVTGGSLGEGVGRAQRAQEVGPQTRFGAPELPPRKGGQRP
jgi:hypothetical protein